MAWWPAPLLALVAFRVDSRSQTNDGSRPTTGPWWILKRGDQPALVVRTNRPDGHR